MFVLELGDEVGIEVVVPGVEMEFSLFLAAGAEEEGGAEEGEEAVFHRLARVGWESVRRWLSQTIRKVRMRKRVEMALITGRSLLCFTML